MRPQLPPVRSLLMAALYGIGVSCAADTYCIYTAQANNAETLREQVQKIAPQLTDIAVKQLPYACQNKQDAALQADAIAAGVSELPCLVISDEKGAYAVLRLESLTPQAISQATETATTPERIQHAEQRRLNADIHLLCANLGIGEPTDEELAEIVKTCKNLMAHPKATTEQQQFIGYRCLYPALLLQYTRGYTGAHTPYTEAKFLEAIAALEAARDLNRETKIGKEAFAERERLRAARREARKYE